MSKSYRIPLGGGYEQDMLTKARRLHSRDGGRPKRAKRAYNRRQRRALKPTEDD